MINTKSAKKFCCEEFYLIQNYDKAIADTSQTWHLHHRAEILPCGKFTPQDLDKFGLYYNRPASELVFLTKFEHNSIHTIARWSGRSHTNEAKAKMRNAKLGKKATDDAKKNMSEAHKGSKNGFFGKHHSEEAKKKMSEARIGKPSWNKGIKPSAESVQKMKQSHLGKHWWNNGIIEVNQKECPEGFVCGRLRCKQTT